MADHVPPPSETDYPDYAQVTPITARANGNGTGAGGRVPPHDLSAEASLLGAMLLRADAIEAGLDLTAKDFFKPAHGHIWQAIVDLHRREEPADVVTVANELHRGHLLDAAGGKTYLIELQAGTPAISNAAKYAGIVNDFAILREAIGAAGDIAELGYSMPDDIDAFLTTITDRFDKVRRPVAGESMFTNMADVATELDPPSLCPRSDNACCFIYPGRVHSLIGPSEAGKSWVAALWCRQLIEDGEHVVVLDWEDTAIGWKSRMVADMGMDEAVTNERFHYAQRDARWTDASRRELASRLDVWRPALVVIDAMTPALATEGADDWRGVDIAAFYTDVVRVCRNAGAAVLILDHVNKADETQTGSHYKKGGLDGVQYKLRNVYPMGRGKRGLSALSIGKDRHGFLRGIAVGDNDMIGTLIVDSSEPADMTVQVAAPVGNVGTVTSEGAFRYPKVMERISRVVEAAPEGVVRAGLKDAVGGNDQNRARAINALVREGWCVEEAGTRRIKSVTAFRADSAPDL